MTPAPLPLVTLGLAVGFVSGMFGVGGGFMLTPLLHVLLGIPYPVAVGSGACQMIGTASSAYLRHRGLGLGEPRVGWIMLGGSLVGVHAGADLLEWLTRLGTWSVGGEPVPAVKLVLQSAFMLALAWIAGLLIIDARRRNTGEEAEAETAKPGPLARLALPPFVALQQVGLDRVSVPVLAYLGLALGFLSGLLGIGGGILLIPALIYGLGFPLREAAGTGVLVLIFTVAVATVEHALAGNVDLAVALPLLVGSSLGAQCGAVATHRMRARHLRGLFALLLLATVGLLALDLGRVVMG